MPQIQFEDETFDMVKRRATDGGYSSVDRFVADVLTREASEPVVDLEQFFTPERVDELRAISQSVREGGTTYTTAKAVDRIAKRREKWLQDHRN